MAPLKPLRSVFLSAGAVLTIALLAVETSAQEAPARPYRGLFGGDATNRNTQLELNWTTVGAYDDDVTAGAQRSYDQRTQVNGTYGAASTGIRYAVHGRKASFVANGTGSGRYLSTTGEFGELDGSGDATATFTLGRGGTLSAFQAFRYQPYYQLTFLNGAAPAQLDPSLPAPAHASPLRDAALTATQSTHYSGTVQFVERFGTKTAMSFGYAYRRSRIGNASEPSMWQFANGSFSRSITRYATLRLGYGYGQDRDVFRPEQAAVITQNIDLGVDYARPLSASRRTAFGFSSGSTVISFQGANYYRLLADAFVAREIGRTWNARLAYHRGGQFVQGVAEPLYADSVDLRVVGLLSRRFDVSFSGGYSNGQIGLSATDLGFTTYSGTADFGIALTRVLAVRAQYFRYYYDFGRAPLTLDLPSALNRQGIRVGLSGWLPLAR